MTESQGQTNLASSHKSPGPVLGVKPGTWTRPLSTSVGSQGIIWQNSPDERESYLPLG